MLYFISPLVLTYAIYSGNTAYYGGVRNFIPMILGAAAYTWLNFELILGARPKFIESAFGLDKFLRFHSLMAVIAVAMGFAHKLLKGGDSIKALFGSAAVVIFIIATVFALVFLIDTLARTVKPLGVLRNLLIRLKVGKYHVQIILHNATAAAVVLMFVHVMLTWSAKKPFAMTVYMLYFAVSFGLYLYHKIIRRFWTAKRFVVSGIKSENALMTTLTLTPKSGKVFAYTAGQFGFLRILGGSVSSEEHPFTFSSEPTDKDTVSITIKNLGDWTAAVDQIKIGDAATLDAPYGRFGPLFDTRTESSILIAGGVGITPMLSILRYLAKTDPERQILLLWGVNEPDELICREELEGLGDRMRRFSFVPIVANDRSGNGESGYLTQEKIAQLAKAHGCDIDTARFFVCGPSAMLDSVKKSLKTLGVKKRNIHAENFSF